MASNSSPTYQADCAGIITETLKAVIFTSTTRTIKLVEESWLTDGATITTNSITLETVGNVWTLQTVTTSRRSGNKDEIEALTAITTGVISIARGIPLTTASYQVRTIGTTQAVRRFSFYAGDTW